MLKTKRNATEVKRRKFIQSSGYASLSSMMLPQISGAVTRVLTSDFEIEKVLVIFKTHLDIGFTDLAQKVVHTYLNDFIPQALSISEKMRTKDQSRRYIWTTGSWLIHHFLEKSVLSMRKRMEKAIQNGDIAWHGLPFTMHSELIDPSLFELGIKLSENLDKQFGKKTIAAKMTDVPGHSRGIVPILSKNNISLLHIGVNPASTPPDVPPLFRWKAPDGSEIVIMYQKDYGSTMVIPGTKTAINISFTGDNQGPQNPEQVLAIFENLQNQFPSAHITASTLNAVTDEISSIKTQLPVITEELGDTWIHGIGSDPLKVAQFREMSRLRKALLNNHSLRSGDPVDIAFGIPLLMVAEHTWGLDVKTWLKDWDIYKQKDFTVALKKPEYKLMEKSWDEQREYIHQAISQLPEKEIANKKLADLKPSAVNKSEFKELKNRKAEIDTPYFHLKIDPTGGITRLTDKETEMDWASKEQPLCQYSYQTFSKKDYDRFFKHYITHQFDWAIKDFGKPGQEIAGAVSRTWIPAVKTIYQKQDHTGKTLLIDLVVADENKLPVGGSPHDISMELFFPHRNKEIYASLQWFNKPEYRLPEASWFSFVPSIQEGNWILDKMGQPVNFRNVIRDGNRKMHAIQKNVCLDYEGQQFIIESLDAPLVAPGERNLLNFDNRLPEARDGMHFCLHNNVWGTNFMMWFGENMKYRFKMKIGKEIQFG